MPSRTDSIALASQFLDRRVKLLDCQKERITALYDDGKGLSVSELARMFHVNRRLVDFVLFPEKLEENKRLRKEQGGWKKYYKKEIGTQASKKYRQYKSEILKSAHT